MALYIYSATRYNNINRCGEGTGGSETSLRSVKRHNELTELRVTDLCVVYLSVVLY